jgi:hypothetical protein
MLPLKENGMMEKWKIVVFIIPIFHHFNNLEFKFQLDINEATDIASNCS